MEERGADEKDEKRAAAFVCCLVQSSDLCPITCKNIFVKKLICKLKITEVGFYKKMITGPSKNPLY